MKIHRLAATLLALSMTVPAVQAATPAFEAEREWSEFLRTAKYRDVNDAYQALGSVHYGAAGIDAAACRESGARLDAAVATVPVGFALRHAAVLCADATGDTAGAERHLAAMEALSRRALAQAGEGAWALPIRIVRPEDIEALIRGSGFEPRYAYYRDLLPKRHYPLVAVAWDGEQKVERHLVFDYVDTLAALSRGDAYSGYPFDRHLIVDAFVEAWAADDETEAVDAQAVRRAWTVDGAEAKRDALQAGATRGGLVAMQSWIDLCASQSQSLRGCSDGLVDALLPLAESGHALPLTLLALAHHRGIGVGRDDKAAQALLESADRSWHRRGGSVYFAALLSRSDAAWPAWLATRLERAQADGNRDAQVLLASERLGRNAQAPAAADRTFLEADASNRMGQGLAVLAAHAQKHKLPDAEALVARAAAAGHADAQREEAFRRLGKQPGDAQGIELLRAAALGGDAMSARKLAYLAVIEGQWKQAEAWLLGAVRTADLDAMLFLAQLYEDGVEGLGGDLARSVELYQALSGSVPAARRRLAMLKLYGRGTAKDPAGARRLLEQDADEGDADAQMVLAGALVNGMLGTGQERAGRRWYEKAIAGGSKEAMSHYAMWLYRIETTPQGRARAVALLRDADRAGLDTATNNLAWMLCVSPFDDVRDPAAGMEYARRLEAGGELPPGDVDTVAACHAANGDFASAERLQQQAIDRLPNAESYEKMASRMRDRLALFKKREAYIENPADTGED